MRKYRQVGDLMQKNDILNNYNIFSYNVKYYRNKLNITQEQLAEKANCSISYIKQIESCREYKNVTLSTILNICKALNISINDLFSDK